jgi:peptide-methionine (S)-S-oxide reductase
MQIPARPSISPEFAAVRPRSIPGGPSALCLALAVLAGGCVPNGGPNSRQKGPNVTDNQPRRAGGQADPAGGPTELATLGGGCFWCVEAVFKEVEGVVAVESGYAGGHVENPTYEQVCTGTTGHAEVCQVRYDPAKISYAELLEIFFKIHDPTTLNRQGADVGTQYRSVIFYHSDDQKKLAEEIRSKLDASGAWDSPIVTEISPAGKFFKAEEYHRDYFRRNPQQGYCQAVIRPKMEKFRKAFEDKLKR